MKLKIITIAFLSCFIATTFGQTPTLELTFTASYHEQYVKLDSIFIENISQGVDTTLYAPDTSLVLEHFTGMDHKLVEPDGFSLSQNYPNPIVDRTLLYVFMPCDESVRITVSDFAGRELLSFEKKLNMGRHSFSFYPGSQNHYILTAKTAVSSRTIKMLNSHMETTGNCRLQYEGSNYAGKSTETFNGVDTFVFGVGDHLRFTGYALTIDSIQGSEVLVDSVQSGQDYIFEIHEGIPCRETPVVEWQGQSYNTLTIGDQCWMKENLNAGVMIDGNIEMTDNGIIEKYCYNSNEDSCDVYGGLYSWDEMMEYELTPGTQGICPSGWHIPTDEEWKMLEGSVDSQYGYPDPVWDQNEYRGFDAGLNLKSRNRWNSKGNGTDLFGFNGLPGGYRNDNGYTYGNGNYGIWGTSNESISGNAWMRELYYNSEQSYRNKADKSYGLSVRCLRDF